ncbi:gamma-glutamyl-gamma-aminobutyrate hydrolase family protein [Companilactobacillus mishanensis]|uniref:Gamma-glutamyl-gamma-aminobutyrate hydrolase family protein n=1 Tax=Companilactobacillus mishanensis TaxID=2486008 RepID=A0A5P0ZKG2_9LACO|nr:gamma-glutamyl-gamma-aminobutyrate hydrolase family protein [Companilactobacillus mishanensis]
MKKVGIVANQYIQDSAFFQHQDATFTFQGNVTGIQNVGAVPVLIPIQHPEHVDEYLKLVDAVLIPGGQDVDPTLYGEKLSSMTGTISRPRDKFELELITKVLKKNMPLMGFCRGAQMINVVLGGTLYQDESMIEGPIKVEHQQKNPMSDPSHYVSLAGAGADLLGDRLAVNSQHHQAIHELSDQLLPVAYADDGIIEAFVAKNPDQTILGYQWHPELMVTAEDSIKIFRNFVNTIK